jgi:hypothetical protein
MENTAVSSIPTSSANRIVDYHFNNRKNCITIVSPQLKHISGQDQILSHR